MKRIMIRASISCQKDFTLSVNIRYVVHTFTGTSTCTRIHDLRMKSALDAGLKTQRDCGTVTAVAGVKYAGPSYRRKDSSPIHFKYDYLPNKTVSASFTGTISCRMHVCGCSQVYVKLQVNDIGYDESSE